MHRVRLLIPAVLFALAMLFVGTALIVSSENATLSPPASNAGSGPPTLAAHAPTVAATGTLAFVEVYTYSIAPYFSEHVVTTDVDRDGRADVVLAETKRPPWSGRVVLLHNLGNWQFSATPLITYPTSYLYDIQAADLNNDQWPDLVQRTDCAINVLLNDQAGGFTTSWTGSKGWDYCGWGLALADMNGDGAVDILAGHQSGNGGMIDLYTNNGLGTVFTRTWRSAGYGDRYAGDFSSVVPARLNQDSWPDIVGTEIYGAVLATFLGDGTGITFTPVMSAPLGQQRYSNILKMVGGNLNGDSLTDIVLSVDDMLRAYVAQGDGTFSEIWTNSNLPYSYALALRDFDHDGYDDLFHGSFYTGQMAVYLNQPPSGTLQLAWTGHLPSGLYTGIVDDLDGDGNLDLIVGEESVLHIYRSIFLTQHYYFPVVFRH